MTGVGLRYLLVSVHLFTGDPFCPFSLLLTDTPLYLCILCAFTMVTCTYFFSPLFLLLSYIFTL